MQPVRTKGKTGFSRKTALLVSVAVLLALFAALYFLLRPAEPAVTGEDGKEQSVLTLLDHDDALLSRITVHPSRSDSYTLVKTEAGWKLESDPEYPLREDRIGVLAHYAAHLTADELAAEGSAYHSDASHLSDYGLDPGSCSAEVELTTGERYTITLGNAAPMDEVRYYAAVSGNRNIYTVTSDVMDGLNVQFHSLHPVSRPAISASLIDRISIGGDTDDSGFVAERTGAGWRMIRPFRYPLSDSAMESLLSALENIRFSTWVGKDTPLNRHKYGFEKQGTTISIDFAASVLTVPDEEGSMQVIELPESNITIIRGGSYSSTAYYYLYNGDIMTGTVVSFGFLRDFSWRKYAAPVPFVYGQNNLSEVTVTSGGHTDTYQISYVERILPNNEFEKDENGNTLYEMRVRKNGQAIDANAFSAYYEGLTALKEYRVLEKLTFFRPEEDGSEPSEPAISVSLSPEDHSETITVSLYPGPYGMDYLSVDGVSICCVTKDWEKAMAANP